MYGGAQARGTFFKVNPAGGLTTLSSFNASTGMGPLGDSIFSSGLLYGVTSFGGANNTGTFFRITPSGELTALASFPPNFYASPFGGLSSREMAIFTVQPRKAGALITG